MTEPEKYKELDDALDLRDLISNHAEYYITEVLDDKFTVRSNTVEDWLKRKKCVIVIDKNTNDKMLLTPFELSMDGVSDNVFRKTYQQGKFTTLTFNWLTDKLAEHSTPKYEWSLALLRRFHWEWFNLLQNYLVDDEFIKLNKKLNTTARGEFTIFPAKENVYKAFSYRPDTLRVIFISLDPYKSEHHANGNAFATDQISKPISLGQIEKAIKKEMEYKDDWILQNNLEHLIKQGFMFLNSALTVNNAGITGYFVEDWRPFINKVLQLLNTFEPLIFVLLGKTAQTHETIIDSTKHTIFKIEHPSYAARQKRDWNSDNIFIKINQKLAELGTPQITY